MRQTGTSKITGQMKVAWAAALGFKRVLLSPVLSFLSSYTHCMRVHHGPGIVTLWTDKKITKNPAGLCAQNGHRVLWEWREGDP